MTDRCGSYAGVAAHRKAGTPVCPDCRAACAAYAREWRRHRTTGRAHLFPVVSPATVDVATFNGLGAVIARGLRESA